MYAKLAGVVFQHFRTGRTAGQPESPYIGSSVRRSSVLVDFQSLGSSEEGLNASSDNEVGQPVLRMDLPASTRTRSENASHLGSAEAEGVRATHFENGIEPAEFVQAAFGWSPRNQPTEPTPAGTPQLASSRSQPLSFAAENNTHMDSPIAAVRPTVQDLDDDNEYPDVPTPAAVQYWA